MHVNPALNSVVHLPTMEDYVGETPLVRLQRMVPKDCGSMVLCKLEGGMSWDQLPMVGNSMKELKVRMCHFLLEDPIVVKSKTPLDLLKWMKIDIAGIWRIFLWPNYGR